MMENNILLKTDSYKISHHRQYPPNTTTIFSTGSVVGAVKHSTIRVGRKGKSIKWRIKEVGDGLGNHVYKVQGFAELLPYR